MGEVIKDMMSMIALLIVILAPMLLIAAITFWLQYTILTW